MAHVNEGGEAEFQHVEGTRLAEDEQGADEGIEPDDLEGRICVDCGMRCCMSIGNLMSRTMETEFGVKPA